MMTHDNLKQVFISIVVGACVAFLTTFFEEMARFLRENSTEVISGISSSMVYIAKAYKG